MAVVKYAPGIEYAKGSLAKPKKVDGHNHGDYLIATHREAATTNPNCTRLYVRGGDTYGNTLPMDQLSLAARARFGAVAQAVNARAKDLSKITQDQEAFLAQRDLPNGKKTMKAYLWDICGTAYDDQNS